jgi:digeranylgeranylglycerophospholipid reductase
LARGAILEEVAGGLSASLPLERSVAPGLLLVGDAARLIDPLTGAGIQNALLSGLFAGETAAMAVRSGDASEAALLGYDRRWRSRMEEDLARHYILKEALQKLDDEAINKIVRAIVEAKIERYTADAILNALRTRCPEVLVAFEGLI